MAKAKAKRDGNSLRAVWKPQQRQAAFMRRWESEALYGGAAGGGKSETLVIEALRQADVSYYRALILRKTYKQLSELIDKSMKYYPRVFPGARYNGTDHCWRMPSGAKIYFGGMQYTKDKINYQGQQYDYIAFDELTHFTWDEYNYLFSRNRSSGPGLRAYIRASANPGGVGHGWVKSRFITAGKPMETIWSRVQVPDATGQTHNEWRSRVFVPASVFDNQILLNNNPEYLRSLASMPEAERNALLYGNWDTFSGQVFTEWHDDPDHYEDQHWTHVIEPFDIPPNWIILRGMDWGFTKPFSVMWYAVDESGRMYGIHELYGCTGTPDEGVQWQPDQVAAKIKQIEAEDPNLKGRYIRGIADTAITAQDGREDIRSIFERAGVYWDLSRKDRLNGKMQCHYRLAFDTDGLPLFQVFRTCKHFIRTVPELVYDSMHVEDVDTKQEDHIYDQWRYVMMERPISRRASVAPPKWKTDPLEMHKPEKTKSIFMRV